jgi:alpha-glucosidase
VSGNDERQDRIVTWRDGYRWWQWGIIYEIYIRSFQDTDADGCGDLNGILQRLDYLEWLGVNIIWVTPFYPSPMEDFGYDISDYTAVHPLFGSMADFEGLLEEVHRRGMHLVLDFVPNHTSDQHPWFQESASSRESARRDWYLWSEPGPDNGLPNNWLSEFAGSAWQPHQATGQYYYHAFLPEQPDLNWRNPEVCEAMFDVMRFWLDKGVDGFRVDVMWHLIKDAHMRDNPPNPEYREGNESPYNRLIPVYSSNRPEVHEVVHQMRKVLDTYEQRVLIGEIYLPIDELVTYYGNTNAEAHLPFNFQLIHTPWDAAHVRRVVDKYEGSLPQGAWPNWVLGNHDQHRIASRIGPEQARIAAMLLLTLRGTPTLYYGEELGMPDVPIPKHRTADPRERRSPGIGLGRDPERTPMQWSAAANAAFSSADPWLPVAADHATCNVEVERNDPDSMLSLYRRLIAVRQSEPALAIGHYAPHEVEPPLLGYLRRYRDQAFLVLLNFSGEPREHHQEEQYSGQVEISTIDVRPEGRRIDGSIVLRPHEGILVRLDRVPAEHPSSTIA